jgi:AbrB family looped-hinge helix DNA binding protein
MTTILDDSGRIEIPENVRKALGWKAGSVVEVDASGNEVHIRIAGAEPSIARIGNLLVFTGTPEREIDIDEAIGTIREERIRHVSGTGR